ncbi:MAG: NAD(P)-binding protein [Verrucomicrobiota bacterium]
MARELRIVGGGLAGLSLAVALSKKGYPVTVFEAGQLPRHRVCGEFICGVSDQTLKTLGIEEDFSGALIHRESVWRDGEGREIYRAKLPRTATGISRHLLDYRLVERIRRQGGEVHLGERWRGDVAEEGTVFASGRLAERTDWLGFKMHIKGDLPSELSLFLGDEGYVGLSAVEGGYWNICGLFRKRDGVRGSKEAILGHYADKCSMPAVSDLLAGSKIQEGSAAGVAGVSFALPQQENGSMRIGDAWAVIPPFTGNGMSIALESAETAIAPLSDWMEGSASWSEVVGETARAHERKFLRRLRVANFIHPWLLRSKRRPFLNLAAKSRLLPFQSLFSLTH